ncbi:MAG: hypothetical protein FWH43_04160 [Endomicrobia bacterium]|nr:hypothetical protein [Endomicrobiia bacterium]
MKLKKVLLLSPLFVFAFASFAYCADESGLKSAWTSQGTNSPTTTARYELTEDVIYGNAMPSVTEEDVYTLRYPGWPMFGGTWSRGYDFYTFSVKSATYTFVEVGTTTTGWPFYQTIPVYASTPSTVRQAIDANQKSAAFTFITGDRNLGPGVLTSHSFEYLTITNGLFTSTNTSVKGGGAYGNYYYNYTEQYQYGSGYSMTNKEIEFKDIHFISNTVRGNNTANGANVYGGAVFIGGYSGPSLVRSIDVAFSSGIRFIGNNSSGYGGAYASLYDGVNTTFGFGTVDITTYTYNEFDEIISTHTFAVSDFTLFESNQAGKDGGAVYFKGGTGSAINFQGAVTFNSNSAGGSGGAVYYEKTNASGSLVFGDIDYPRYSPVQFTNNSAGGLGGAIYSNVSLTFYDEAYFASNTAALGGGAIYITNGSLAFSTHSATTFYNNSTSNNSNAHGGAIYKGSSSPLQFEAGIYLMNNTAGGSGGAIYNAGGAVTFSSDVYMTGNTAQFGRGGAIYLANGALAFNASAEITGNYSGDHGGAIYSGNNSDLIFYADAVIQNNTSGGRGGAINKGFGGDVYFGSDADISNNSAYGHGGAIYSSGGNVIFQEANFTGNKSLTGSGGAIYKSDSAGDLLFAGPINFTSNTAALGGGAIFSAGGHNIFHDNAGFYWNASEHISSVFSAGGAIYSQNSVYEFRGDAVFGHNSTAFSRGGAIFVQSSTFTFSNGASFYANAISGNTIEGGAAIFSVDSNLNFLSGGITDFSENKTLGITSVSGGAIYALRSVYGFESTVNFTSNSATAMGGAAAFIDSSAEFADNVVFQNNSAENGGALYLGGTSQSSLDFKSGAAFTGNTSSGDGLTGGGAVLMYASEGTKKIDFASGKTASFADNKSYANGGAFAVYSGGQNIINFNGAAQFDSNTASASGGAFYSFLYATGSGAYNFTDSGYFTNNEVGISGGAIYAYGDNEFNINSNIAFTNNSASGIDANGGGAIYSNLSAFTFTGSAEVQFQNNSAYSRGGAVYQEKGIFDFQSDAKFVLNSAGVSGGAIYASTGAMTFNGSVSFESNTASGDFITSGGGAVYAFEQFVEFLGAAQFSNNKAEGITNGSGGAVYASASGLSFSDPASFTGNEAGLRGGAVYQDNGTLTFSKTSGFANNAAGFYGGAVYSSESGSLFTGIVSFANNEAGFRGGAVYQESGVFDFQSDAGFTLNSAGGSGGAVYASTGIMTFNGSVLFESNTASGDLITSGGGAIYAFAQSVNFLAGSEFKNNSAQGAANGSGGAVYALGSSIDYNGLSTFADNKSNLKGGAIYQDGGTSDFSSGQAVFTNNAAGAEGGAVYLTGSGKIDFADVTFTENFAGANGGAVYLKGLSASEEAKIYFKQTVLDLTVFNANTANGLSNSIHFAGNSYAEFDASVSQYQTTTINDAITSEGTNNTLTVLGCGGNFNMNGSISGYGSLNLNLDGVSFNLAGGSNMSLNDLSVLNGSVLNIQTASPRTISVSGDLTVDPQSELKFGIFSYGDSDVIEVGGKALLDGTVSVRAGVGTYDNLWFTLVNADDGFEDTDFAVKSFDNNAVNRTFPRDLKYDFEFDETQKKFMLVVNGIRQSYFSSLDKLGKNQKNAAKMYDALSSNADRPLANVIDGINEMTSVLQQKQALLETSPYFIANALNYNMHNRSKRGLFDHIEKTDKPYNVWAYVDGGSLVFGSDENSYGDFKAVNYAITFGADANLADDLIFGFFGKYGIAGISQESNKGDISSFGGGAYALAGKNALKFKAALDYEGQAYDITRSVNVSSSGFVRSAKSEFKSYVLEADAEASYEMSVSEIFSLNPFAGINGAWAHYGDFAETGADTLNLEIDGSNVFVSNARIGISANAKISELNLGASIEYNRLLSGYMPELTSRLNGKTETFKSVGAETGKDAAGFNLSASYDINENFKAYAGAAIKIAENFSNLGGTIGAKYSF